VFWAEKKSARRKMTMHRMADSLKTALGAAITHIR
jgi:hypothetical protein